MYVVGFDLDGVFYNFGASLRKFIVDNGLGTEETTQHITNWHFYRDWGFTDEQFIQMCHDGVDAGTVFTHGDPLTDAKNTMNRLYEQGHEIVVITDRPFGADNGKASRRATYKWLRDFGFRFHRVVFTADKGKVPVDWMIDDKLENYDAMDAEGVSVYLLNRPWNEIPGGDDRRRVDSVEEFIFMIELITAATEKVIDGATENAGRVVLQVRGNRFGPRWLAKRGRSLLGNRYFEGRLPRALVGKYNQRTSA